MFNKIVVIIKKRKRILPSLLRRNSIFFPDKLYLKMFYRLQVGKKLDLHNPKTFGEKMQWLKLYDKDPRYTQLVDKYEAKKIVSEMIGEEYIIPTIGIWDKFEDIDFDKLPNQFVLKCTHDSKSVTICKNKSTLDIRKIEKKINKRLKFNMYAGYREWQYKNVKPRIIAEKYMTDGESQDLKDYKFFCFNGKVKFCQIIANRTSDIMIDFYDTEWKHLPFVGLNTLSSHHKNASFEHICPDKYKEMINIAEKLSNGMTFCRVDLYYIENQIYFGEFTIQAGAGMGSFFPEEWNYIIGDMVTLPNLKVL